MAFKEDTNKKAELGKKWLKDQKAFLLDMGVVMLDTSDLTHQECYANSIICGDECEVVKEQLDSKYADMNRE